MTNYINHPHRILNWMHLPDLAKNIHKQRYPGTYVPPQDTVIALKTCHKQKLVSYTTIKGKPGIWALTRIGRLHVANDLNQKINLIELNPPITINNVKCAKLQITVIPSSSSTHGNIEIVFPDEQTICNCDNHWVRQQLVATLQQATIFILSEIPL